MRKPRRSLRRPLTRFERLEGRRLLATDLGQITGVVMNDLENDGAGDIVAVGQQVELFLDNPGAGTVGVFDPSDLSQTTTTTDAAGAYSFDNLVAGNYFVRINPTAGTQTRTGEDVSALISFDATEAMGSTNLTIDDFATAQNTLASTAATNPNSSADVANGGSGGVRDLFARIDSGAGEAEITSDFVGTGILNLSTTGNVAGIANVVWDGADGDATTIDTSGLLLDLLDGGNNSAIEIQAAADRADASVTIRLYSGPNNASEAAVTIVGPFDAAVDGDADESITIPFTSFAAVSGQSAADLSAVTAIEVEFDFTATGQESLDAQVDVVGVVGFTTKTADFTVLNEMSLGDRVWIDVDNDGMLMGGEQGVNDVALSLFLDANNNDIIDADEATAVATTTTSTLGGLAGSYLFTGLLPGDYLVRVDASNFATDAALEGLVTSTGNDVAGMAPDTDVANENDKDKGTAQGDGSVLAKAVTLVGNAEPVNDGDTDSNTNRTLDFGFFGYDLSINKTVDLATAAVGGALVYTIDVMNEGPSNATGVTLTDTLPDGVTFSSGSAGVVGTAGNQTVTATVGALAPGASQRITINVTTDNDATGTLINSATVAGVDEIDVLPNTDTAQTEIEPRIDVQITKVDDDNDQVLAPGDAVAYTLVATNNGPSQATGVVVTDVLPTGMTFVAAGSTVPSSISAVAGGTQLTYNFATLDAGAVNSETITINATIDAGVNGTLTNNASIAANETETIPVANNSASAQSTVAIPLGSLNGKVYVDVDGDNVQDAEDQPIAGVLITLFDDMNNAVATTTTDASGCYEFTGLVPGVYRVVQTQPTAFPDLDETSGTGGADVSGDNQISNITVVGNQVSPANDFTEGLPTIGKRSFFWSNLFGLDNVTNV